MSGIWSNDSINQLKVPSNAAPGEPGFVWGQTVPSELTTFYGPDTSPFGIVGAEIIYTSSSNLYFYRGILANSVVVRGIVFGSNVMETERHSLWGGLPIGNQHWFGYNGSYDVQWYFGSNGGGGPAAINMQSDGGLKMFGRNVCASNNLVNNPATTGAADGTSSATFVNMAGVGSVTSLQITKNFGASQTRLRVFMAVDFFVGVATAATGMEAGVLCNGTDTVVCGYQPTTPTQPAHLHTCGSQYITGLAAATYTIQGRWRRTGAVNTLQRNADDRLVIEVSEVGNP